MDAVAKRKTYLPCSCRELNSGCSDCSQVTILVELSRLIFHKAEDIIMKVPLHPSVNTLEIN